MTVIIWILLVADILVVEAYHAGSICTLLYKNRDIANPYRATFAIDVVQAIATPHEY